MPPGPVDLPLRFGRFEISPSERLLRVDGRPVALGSRAFDLLLVLAQRHERLVTKQELLDLVWPGVVVEEHNIAAQISSLRKVLGPGVIATVPGRGYRFLKASDPPNAAPHGLERLPRTPRCLPQQRTRFIGRESALADLTCLLPQTRLITLTGIGGCGKTRLALRFAGQHVAEFADGIGWVDLAPLQESYRVVSVCAAALEIDARSDLPLAQQLAVHLETREALIVLDNCEHVRDGAAALVNALLSRPGRSRIIATSREALGLPGEQLYPVRPLSLPATTDLNDALETEAVQVFADRVRLALPEFEVNADNAVAVVEICRQLDGIALAIELAAARAPMLSVFDLAARLQDRFRLLTGGSSTSSRHQTLQATMQWSYDLLAPAEQRMLCRMAVFAGSWTLDAATAVAQATDEYEALTLLTALYEKSLLIVDRGASGDGRPGLPRYRMLETVRQYAQQQLDDSSDVSDVRARHAEYFLELAESAAPHLRGPQQSLWMARLRDEQDNLVAALAWCTQQHGPSDPQRGLRLAAATARYWLFNEVELGCRLVSMALKRAVDGGDSAAGFHASLGLAGMYMHRGLREAGLPHARMALAVAERMRIVEWQAIALSAIGTCLEDADEEGALQHYAQARDLARSGGHAAPLGSALNNIAAVEFRLGNLDAAEKDFRESLHLARAQGDVRMALIVLHNLVRLLVAACKQQDALACAVEAESLLRGVGENVLKLELLEVVGGLASSQGEYEFAARLLGFAGGRFTDAGYRRPPMDETQFRHWSTVTRQGLGDAAFEKAETAGRALELEVAMLELRQWLARGR